MDICRRLTTTLIFILVAATSPTVFSLGENQLFEEIAEMDRLLFSAQNRCDLEAYASFLSEDFEFFHDVAGYTASKDDEMKDMAIFCGPEQRTRQPLRRQITDGSLQVFEMQGFGAVQFCDHKFFLQIPDGTEKVVGSGKFTGIWKKIDGEWKVTRVLSYDHQPLAEAELPPEILEKYTGNYLFSDRIVNIKVEGKFLRVTDLIDNKSVWSKSLFPESQNTFYLNYENVVYEFLDGNNNDKTLNIYERGTLLETGKRSIE